MSESKRLDYVKNVLEHMPEDWLSKTTHRLDIYNEKLAKTQFLEKLESLFKKSNSDKSALSELPTAYDYIRLGHPLSCLLEWTIAGLNNLDPKNVISFSSKTMPILAVLRKNLLENKNTKIVYKGELPPRLNVEVLKNIYGYNFSLESVSDFKEIQEFDGSTVVLFEEDKLSTVDLNPNIDFFISAHSKFGSVALVNGDENESYISEIQHVRRRETVAMTPSDCLLTLKSLVGEKTLEDEAEKKVNKLKVLDSIKEITNSDTKALLGSCGLSVQYAITMGLVHDALENHKGKEIKIIVPPNCYGGTNDQARRVAACIEGVEVVDLPVDSGQNMVESIDKILTKLADENTVPYILAEIPTNPRVEVPELLKLKEVLTKVRKNKDGGNAVDPVFILDQTFCPNVHFLGEGNIFSTVRTISYVSGSKFPSGGLCTAGYCVSNKKSESLMGKIEEHLKICDNEATDFQVEVLAKQMPSMNQRIKEAYKNTREFVNHIMKSLPGAKINFVSEELAEQGFTPSVFSLDLPTKGDSAEEKETYKRELNYKLINMMIEQIPNESQHCVSYGQLKGCYWTIPATSTQGTTKEGDKDYIVRVAGSPDMDVKTHKKVFLEFTGII
ncbi:MAG: cystathionine beta-synthase [Bdellovibrionales bacterium]